MLFCSPASLFCQEPDNRPRARDIGLRIGVLEPGPHNAITDVEGVRVGHATVHNDRFCTGVTAIVPRDGNVFRNKLPAAMVVGNGFGKLVGLSQVEELGTLETPVALTNTLSVFRAAEALVDYTLGLPGNEAVRSVNPVAGETNDGYLNDIRARGIEKRHVLDALSNARSGPVAEGAVGAGKGTRCLGYKGGIGTSSRQTRAGNSKYTVGVLVQSNFGGVLTIGGIPVGEKLRKSAPEQTETRERREHGSCMIVVATDAPLDARQLKRVARRALLGLGAVGSPMSHGSGDYVIAFSTRDLQDTTILSDAALTPLFQATREATEEAIVNSMLRASTTTGYRGRTVKAIPIDRLIEICREHKVIGEERGTANRR